MDDLTDLELALLIDLEAAETTDAVRDAARGGLAAKRSIQPPTLPTEATEPPMTRMPGP